VINSKMLLIAFVLVNYVSLMLFFLDKKNAMSKKRRIRESTLLASAFLGPFGAYAGMIIFRHKTRKSKFVLVPIFMILQIVVIVVAFPDLIRF